MSSWWKKGILNTLEHVLTRGSDALITILLIRALDASLFTELALAQAWWAPVLFFFISPETVFYRDYATWKVQGRIFLQARLVAFRRFGILKALAAVALAVGASIWRGNAWGAWIWAAGLPLIPQVLGPDREFLRMSLRLRALNILTLVQKLSLLGGVAGVLWVGRTRPEWILPGISGALGVSLGLSWLLGKWFSYTEIKKISELPQTRDMLPTLRGWRAVADALRGFSFWSHVSGMIQNWVQTMDLFFLGIFQCSSVATLALYAVALKLSNLLLALPMALANIFGVWIGQKKLAGPQGVEIERDEVKRLTLRLYLACMAQTMVFWAFSPWVIEWLSRGRWSAEEQDQIFHWLILISTGTMMFASTFLMSSWITLRQSVRRLFAQVYVPWAVVASALYVAAAYRWGFLGAAIANVGVSISFIALLWWQWKTPT